MVWCKSGGAQSVDMCFSNADLLLIANSYQRGNVYVMHAAVSLADPYHYAMQELNKGIDAAISDKR